MLCMYESCSYLPFINCSQGFIDSLALSAFITPGWFLPILAIKGYYIMSYHHPYLSWCTSILWILTFSLTQTIYYDCWYRGKIKIKDCSTWIHAKGYVYLFAILMSCPVLIARENYFGSNNYEHFAQLNSEIETKHIAINPFLF